MKAKIETTGGIERRIRASEADTDDIKLLLDIIGHLQERGTGPDSSVGSMAVAEYIPLNISMGRKLELLDQLVSMGLVEEFRPAGSVQGRFDPYRRVVIPERRYRLSQTATEACE